MISTALLLFVVAADPPAGAEPVPAAEPSPDAVTQCRALLDDGNFWRCVAAAKASFEKDDKQAGPLLVALLETANQFSEAARARRKLGETPLPPAPPSAAGAIKRGETAYVAASRLFVRAGPSTSAKAVVGLDINTPLQVDSIDGEWAKVKVTGVGGTRFLYANPFGVERFAPEVPDSASQVEGGYVAAAFLEPQMIDLIPLLQRANQATKPAEAAALWERASALQPKDHELLRKVVRAALDAGLYAAAARAGYLLAGYNDTLADLQVEAFDLAYGCKGDVFNTEMVGPAAIPQSGKIPENSCVVAVAPWPPCDACSKGPKPSKKDAAKLKQARATYDERSKRVQAAYPQEPWLRLRLRNRTGLPTQEAILHVVATVVPDGCAALDKPPAVDELVQTTAAYVPVLAAQEGIELWMNVPQYRSRTFSVLSGVSDEEAKAYGVDQVRADWNLGASLSDAPKSVRTLRVEGEPCCCR